MEGLNLRGLRNSEFYQFISDAVLIVLNNNPALLKVKKHHQRMEEILKELKKLFKVKLGFVTTEQLQALDLRRDRAITGLATTLAGLTYHFKEETRKHAEVLVANLKLYGNGAIARENYVSETAIITNLVNDWDNKPELQAAVTALALEDWKMELDEANIAFNDAYIERNSEKGAVSPEKLAAKRAEATDAWYKLRDRLAAFHEIEEGAEPYGKVIKELEAHVAQYIQLLKNRKGKNGNTDEPTDGQTDEPADDQPEEDTDE